MASPHSRRQTTGAFGNNKPRDIKRDFSRPEPVPVDTTPREPTIADNLIVYAQPILQQAGGNHTAAKGAMNVAILIWNAAIEGEAKIADAKTRLASLRSHRRAGRGTRHRHGGPRSRAVPRRDWSSPTSS
jgi:hypothetical protein